MFQETLSRRPCNHHGFGFPRINFRELGHAIDNCEHGHCKEFKKIVTAVGLCGCMASTHESQAFLDFVAEKIVKPLGKYPAGSLVFIPDATPRRRTSEPRAKTVKFRCSCGYEARVPAVCVVEHGAPICPGCEIETERAGALSPTCQHRGVRRRPSFIR
jgi:hypothetical protein